MFVYNKLLQVIGKQWNVPSHEEDSTLSVHVKLRKQANLEKKIPPVEITTRNKNNMVFICFYCLLSATCLFLPVWGLTPLLTLYAISMVVRLLRIYLGAITSAFLRSLQATDSFPTWSVVGGKWLHNAPLINFPLSIAGQSERKRKDGQTTP